MIGTSEGCCIASIGATHAVASMAAYVKKGVDLAVGVPHHYHRVFSHVSSEEVTGIWDL